MQMYFSEEMAHKFLIFFKEACNSQQINHHCGVAQSRTRLSDWSDLKESQLDMTANDQKAVEKERNEFEIHL